MRVIAKKTFAALTLGVAAAFVAFGCQKTTTDSETALEPTPVADAPSTEEAPAKETEPVEETAESDETLRLKYDALTSALSGDDESLTENVKILEKARGILDRMQAPSPSAAILAATTSIQAEGLLGSVENLEKIMSWAAEKVENASAETLNQEAIVGVMIQTDALLDLIETSPNGPTAAKPFLKRIIARIDRSSWAKERNALTGRALVELRWRDARNSLLLEEYDEAAVKIDASEKFFFEQDNLYKFERLIQTKLKRIQEKRKRIQELSKEREANNGKISPEQYEELRNLLNEPQQDDEAEETRFLNACAAAQFGLLRALALHFSGRTEEAKELFELGIKCDFEAEMGANGKKLYLLLQALQARGSDISDLTYMRETLEILYNEEFAKGIGIAEVVDDSQAAKLGVTTDDRLLKYDGWPIADAQIFTYRRWADVAEKKQGDVEVEFLVDGTPKTFTVQAGRLGIALNAE